MKQKLPYYIVSIILISLVGLISFNFSSTAVSANDIAEAKMKKAVDDLTSGIASQVNASQVGIASQGSTFFYSFLKDLSKIHGIGRSHIYKQISTQTHLTTWLSAFKLVAQHIDETPSDNQTFLHSVMPPSGIGSSGMAPNVIDDEKQRNAYIKAIKENEIKAQRANFQWSLRQALSYWLPLFEGFIITRYSNSSEADYEALINEIRKAIPKSKVQSTLIETVNRALGKEIKQAE